jgi:hypothetical protein
MPSPNDLWLISVVFETRPDGGLRVYSDDVPGFMLSHTNTFAVYGDVKPALETIIGEMMHSRVTIEPADKSQSLPWLPIRSRETRVYEARLAA